MELFLSVFVDCKLVIVAAGFGWPGESERVRDAQDCPGLPVSSGLANCLIPETLPQR